MIDRAECVGSVLEVADSTLVDVELDSVAIMPGFAGNDADVAFEFNLADAAQHFAQDGSLLLQLGRVVNVLVLAAAAALEIRTGSIDARRRRRD